jgi:hypothetical protein
VGVMLSQPGSPATDFSQMDYTFNWFVGPDNYDLEVDLDTIEIGPDKFCRWQLALFVNTNFLCLGNKLQSYPQTTVFVDTWDASDPCPGFGDDAKPALKIYPAPWALSGSPYPPIPHPW